MRRMRRWRLLSRAQGEVIDAVYSDDPRRQMWGADKLLSSWLARDHPLAPARRSALNVTVNTGPRVIKYRWRTDADDKREVAGHEPSPAQRLDK
jgi:hypothetical protein